MNKKLLLTAAALSFGASVFAQHEINASNIPAIGDVDTQIIDTIPNAGVTAGSAGVDQVWNITDIDLQVEEITEILDPSTSPVAQEFPEADLMIDGGFGPMFLDVQQDKVEIIGMEFQNPGNGQAEAVKWENPQTFFALPSTYQTSFSDDAHWTATFDAREFSGGQLDSARITYDAEIEVEFDGTGTLTTPIKTFTDVLRERNVTIVETTFEVCIPLLPGFPCTWADAADVGFPSPPADTTVTYNFYNADSKFTLASVAYNASETQVRTVSFNGDESLEPSSVKELEAINAAVYPNPATDVIFFKNIQPELVTITNITGQVVLQQENIETSSINISTLKPGAYIVKMNVGDHVYHQNISVN